MEQYSRRASSAVEIGPGTEADIPGVAALLGTAFLDDVELRAFLDGAARGRRLTSYLAAEARSILTQGGAVDVARSAGRATLSAAVWEQPGFGETIWQLLRSGPAKLEAVRARGLVNWMLYRSEFMRFRPSEPHWHLVRLATDAGHRGQGLGTALLEMRLELIDRTGVAAHLESSSHASAQLYERLGFAVVGEIRLPAGACILAMTRPGRGRS